MLVNPTGAWAHTVLPTSVPQIHFAPAGHPAWLAHRILSKRMDHTRRSEAFAALLTLPRFMLRTLWEYDARLFVVQDSQQRHRRFPYGDEPILGELQPLADQPEAGYFVPERKVMVIRRGALRQRDPSPVHELAATALAWALRVYAVERRLLDLTVEIRPDLTGQRALNHAEISGPDTFGEAVAQLLSPSQHDTLKQRDRVLFRLLEAWFRAHDEPFPTLTRTGELLFE